MLEIKTKEKVAETLDRQYEDQGAAPAFEKPNEQSSQPMSGRDYALLSNRSAEQTNWVISLLHNGIGDWTKKDPNFNPVNYIKDTKYENYPEYFINADNAEDIDDAKRKVDEFEEYKDLAQRAPTAAFWSAMAWGVGDPALAIPGYGAIRAAKTGAIAAKTAAITGGITAGVLGAEEAVLQAGNEERTAIDSAINVVAGGIVGAGVGGLVGHFAANNAKVAVNQVDELSGIPGQVAGQVVEPNIVNAVKQSEDAVKKVLAVSEDNIPADETIVKQNALESYNRPMSDIIAEHNMEGHTSPFMRKWQQDQENLKIERGVKIYHGSDAVPTIDALQESYSNPSSLFGPGTYVTDSEDVARTYAKKSKNVMSGILKPGNFIDADALPSEEVVKIINNTFSQLSGGVKFSLKTKIKVRDIYKELKNSSTYPKTYSNEEIEFALKQVNMELAEKGFNGIKYKGGVETGSPPHTAYVLFGRPKDQILSDSDKYVQNMIKLDELQKIDDKELEEALTPKGGTLETEQSIGAAHISLDAKIARLPNWAIKSMSIPGVRPAWVTGALDDSAFVRAFTQRIYYQHVPFEGNLTGEITPVSLFSKIEQDMLEGLDFNKSFNEHYLRYVQVDPTSHVRAIPAFLRSHKLTSGGKYLTRREFESEIATAMNNGDKHAIPEVQQMAQYARQILNKGAEKLKKAGVDIGDQPNYWRRVYNIPRIMSNRADFEKRLIKNLVNKTKARLVISEGDKEQIIDAVYDIAKKKLDWIPKKGQELKEMQLVRPMTIEDAQERAREATNDILKMGDKQLQLGDLQRLQWQIGSDAKQARTLDYDYEDMKDYLVQDFKGLMHQYLSGVSKTTHFKELMDDMQVDNINQGRIKIREEYDMKIDRINNLPEKVEQRKAPSEKLYSRKQKDKMIKALNYAAQKSEKNYNDHVAIALGQFKQRTSSDSFWRITDHFNIVRLLEGVTISSLGDPMAAFIKNSAPDVVWNGWLSELKRFITFTNGMKKQDMRDALTAIQGEMDDGLRFILNPEYDNIGVGKTERVFQGINQASSKINLLRYWNNFWQRSSHNIAESRILRDINKGWDNLSEKEQQYLLEGSIDKSMAERILRQQKEFGEDIRGTHISNSKMWSDQEARTAFNNLIRLEVHKSPIITEVGDTPKIVQKRQAYKSMFLFKGYPSSATTKLLMSMATRQDTRSTAGLMMITLGGMMTYVIKEKLAGREPNLELPNLIRQSVDRSGILGLVADPLFQTKRAADSIKKYGGKAWFTEPTDYLLGPNASIINPVYSGIMEAGFSQEGISPKTAYQLKALIPYYTSGWLGHQKPKPKKGSSADSKFNTGKY